MKRRLPVVLAVLCGVVPATPAAAMPFIERSGVTTPADEARAAYDAMTPAQRIGQLFMAGVSSTHPSPATLAVLRAHHVGNVILDGNSSLGVTPTATNVAAIDAALTQGEVKPFVATDQEGGEVQRLTGPGFSPMPTALEQGRLSPSVLRTRAKQWGKQLASAGISLNLAPDADTVPSPHARRNQPIGRYDREYGHTPSRVAAQVTAVVEGESRSGVSVTLKHFPGLGRATGNTDLTRRVTDPTRRHDPYLRPFKRGIAAHAPFVMVSLARYPNIDGRPACFSTEVLRGMLRHDLGFRGVIISDSFHAKAVRFAAPATAAVRYFTAGGTMLLDTERPPLYAMERAVRVKAASSSSFAQLIRSDVLRVLRAKAIAGLLS
ncbi:MAG TPA: glycoside hydrolase family 3 N-terminal domain-containing protein [Mycobacteriales bacterium]|jgi:beta-N-acetylhexosaminidase|nr:glycoside hydrolase family 3 N-terminal domain-containing protein [Mycobacteriales bacterium]